MHTITHNKPPRIGLALGSGGARGWAHVGVLRYLQEMHVPVACVAGTSIGALMGAAFAARRLDVLEDLSHELDWKRVARLFIEVGIPRAGLVTCKHIQQFFHDIVHVARIEDLEIPFAAVAADLQSQEQVVLTHGGVVDAIRASIAIPGIFVPARHEGHDLIDGGAVNPLPVDVARELGADVVIAVDVNQRPGRGLPPRAHAPDAPVRPQAHDVPEILARIGAHLPPLQGAVAEVYQRWLRREPHGLTIFEVLTRSVRIAETQLTHSRLLLHPPDVLIRPAVGDLDTLEFHHSADAIEAGHAAAAECAAEIKRFLT